MTDENAPARMYRYLITYELRDMSDGTVVTAIGERFQRSEGRLMVMEDFAPIRAAIQASCAGMPMPGDTISGDASPVSLGSRVLITGVYLLATPSDQLDDEEWRRERNVAQMARDVAYAWSQLGRHDRTALGDMRPDLANALDALMGAVNGPVTT